MIYKNVREYPKQRSKAAQKIDNLPLWWVINKVQCLLFFGLVLVFACHFLTF